MKKSIRQDEVELKPGRRRVLRGLAAGGGALLGGLGGMKGAMAQAGTTEAKLLEAAKREGQVTVYASAGQSVLDRLAAAFRGRYGIPVELFRATSGPVAARFNQEAATKRLQADVLQVADKVFFGDLVQRKLVQPLESLPAFSAWPEKLKTRHYVQFSIVPNGFLYNTKLVTVPLREWRDLLDPRWRGRILLADPNGALGYVVFLSFLRNHYGDDFLRQLAAQKPRLVSSGTPGGEQVAAGEAALYVPGWEYLAVNLKKRTAPIEFSAPDGTTGIERQIGAVAGGPHPNAGLLFVNFALSPEGQVAFNGEQQGASGLPNIPGTLKLPGGYEVANEQRALREKNEIMQLLGLR